MLDVALLIQSIPALMHGMWVTIQISLLSCTIGLMLGILLGVGSASNISFITWPISIYTTLFRGTPMLIQILFIYFVLPQIGISIPPFWGAVLAIGLNSAAYICAIIRSGIAAIGIGQIEAGYVLGFTPAQIMRFIILPQAIRIVLPSLGNEFITLIKDSSLASIINVSELTKEGRIITSRTYDALTVYAAVALCYLALTSLVAYIMHVIEKRIAINAQR